MRAMNARTVGSSAIDEPACSSFAPATCFAVRSTAACMRPDDTAADSTLNQGSTTPIMMPKPPPSSPSRALTGSFMSSAVIGAESLPRRPKPSNEPSTRMPCVARGTSHSVDSSPPATGFVDHTYVSAWCADVAKLFLPVMRSWSTSAIDGLRLAQYLLRDPGYLHSCVDRSILFTI